MRLGSNSEGAISDDASPSGRPDIGGSGSPAPSTTRPSAAGVTEVGMGIPDAAEAVPTLPERGRSGIAKSALDNSGLDTLGLETSGFDASDLGGSDLGEPGLAAPLMGAGAGELSPVVAFAASAAGEFEPPIDRVDAEAGELIPPAPLERFEAGGLGRSGLFVDPSGGGCGGKPAAIR